MYNRFHHDFGPLHVGHLYRFAVHLHDFLGDEAYLGRNIVFYSKPDPKSRANAACLLACYMVSINVLKLLVKSHADGVDLGSHSIMASSFGSCSSRSGESTVHAFP